MASRIFFKASVEKDLRRIHAGELPKIKAAIDYEISADPRSGKQLKGAYKGLFSYRSGDYRIVYTIIPDGVLILRIADRKDVYRNIK